MRKLVEVEPELDPSYIMVDFKKAAINAFEDQFLAVLTGCSIFPKICTEKFNHLAWLASIWKIKSSL